MIDTLAILFTCFAIAFVIVRAVMIDATEPWLLRLSLFRFGMHRPLSD